MHRSRVCAIGIDCPSGVRREMEQFWAVVPPQSPGFPGDAAVWGATPG